MTSTYLSVRSYTKLSAGAMAQTTSKDNSLFKIKVTRSHICVVIRMVRAEYAFDNPGGVACTYRHELRKVVYRVGYPGYRAASSK